MKESTVRIFEIIAVVLLVIVVGCIIADRLENKHKDELEAKRLIQNSFYERGFCAGMRATIKHTKCPTNGSIDIADVMAELKK